MPALTPTILKEIPPLLLFLIGLLLFLLLLLLFIPFRYRGSGARKGKQLSSCLSVPWLPSLLYFSLSYAAEERAEFSALGFCVYHDDETEGTADAAEKNDFDYPESTTPEDSEPDAAKTAVVEQRKAITEQAEILSEHFEAMESVSNGEGAPPQREDKRHRNVPEGE